MKAELKHIDIWSVVKIVFVISLLVGFFISLLYTGFFVLMGSLMGSFGETLYADAGVDFSAVSGVMAIIMVFFGTSLFAVFYTIITIIIIAIYNLLAKWVGGIKVEISHEEVEKLTEV